MSYVIEYQDKMGRRFRAVVAMLPHCIREKKAELRAQGYSIVGY
jgi:hypothetical protein